MKSCFRAMLNSGWLGIAFQGKNGKPGRGSLMLKLHMARMIEFQRKIRDAMEEAQEEIMNLGERAYRKFVRDCQRNRFEMFKQSEKAKMERATERAQMAKKMKVAIQVWLLLKSTNVHQCTSRSCAVY